jgi:hypothetical protein
LFRDGESVIDLNAESATNRSSSAPSIATASRSRAADAGWTDPEGRRPWFSPKLGKTSLVAHGRGLQRPARCAGSFLALSTVVQGWRKIGPALRMHLPLPISGRSIAMILGAAAWTALVGQFLAAETDCPMSFTIGLPAARSIISVGALSN